MARTHSPMDTTPSTEEPSVPFLDYHERLKQCNSMKKWGELIKEIRGPHPLDNPHLQTLFKEKIMGDWLKTNQHFLRRSNKCKFQARTLIDHHDLNFIQYSCNEEYYYHHSHTSADKMKGEKYTCKKCGGIFYKKFTAVTPGALLELDLYEDFWEYEQDMEPSSIPEHLDKDPPSSGSSTVSTTEQQEPNLDDDDDNVDLQGAVGLPFPLPFPDLDDSSSSNLDNWDKLEDTFFEMEVDNDQPKPRPSRETSNTINVENDEPQSGPSYAN